MRTTIFAAVSAAALVLGGCGEGAVSNNETGGEQQADGTLADGVGTDSRFGKAVEAAGLTATLEGPAPYTLIVPSDQAFDALPEGAMPDAAEPQGKEALGQLLSYHMLPGTIMTQDIASSIEAGGGSASLPTMGAGQISASMDGDTLVLTDAAGNAARVTGSEERFSNGVIHRVDAVLRPE